MIRKPLPTFRLDALGRKRGRLEHLVEASAKVSELQAGYRDLFSYFMQDPAEKLPLHLYTLCLSRDCSITLQLTQMNLRPTCLCFTAVTLYEVLYQKMCT